MNQLVKNRLAIVFLFLLTIYLLFIYFRQNERMSNCTQVYSKCVIRDLRYLLLGGIDLEYYYWAGEKPLSVRFKVSNAKVKELVRYIKIGDTLPLLYCKEYPNLNTPIVNGEYLLPTGW